MKASENQHEEGGNMKKSLKEGESAKSAAAATLKTAIMAVVAMKIEKNLA